MSSTASPWDTAQPVASVGAPVGDVTLVEGQTFAISDRAGDMFPNHPHGVFYLDTRVLSRFEARLDGQRLEPVAVASAQPFEATFATRALPPSGQADGDVVAFRRRHVGRGLRERITLTNFGLEAAPVVLELCCEADFADLFDVKESRVQRRGRLAAAQVEEDGALVFVDAAEPVTKRASLHFSRPALLEPGAARWAFELGPGECWELCVELGVELDGAAVEPRFRCRQQEGDEQPVPEQQLASWRARLPAVATDHADLAASVARSGEDLGALRIFDPEHPDTPIVAAGAPWFMTVFGRDSLLTAWMTLLADPSLALGVLETLARFQGTDVDPRTEEEPGKILHEIRHRSAAGPSLSAGDAYYGSVDATPLFVMVLGELRRWGAPDPLVGRLLPHADRALEWVERFGDRDGDGYVEYERQNTAGLANQGWKDSWDAIRFADGTLARPPIALCEVQAYVYGAHLARAHFARQAGDLAAYDRHVAKAADLRRRFNEDFWLEEHESFALALDADKRPVDAVTSNVGHCLWTGIVEPERAAVLADRLLRPDLFSGWGLRTLATTMAAYNPVSYHNGSVWPHDNALCAAGLARYGFTEHAQRIIDGQMAAAGAHGDRLPELFAGFARDQLAVPGSYPASCSPQAWAAAAPLLWLRTLLRLDPWAPEGKVWVAPSLPPSVTRLRVEGIRIGEDRLAVEVEGDDVEVSCTGSSLELVRAPRPPLTALLPSRS